MRANRFFRICVVLTGAFGFAAMPTGNVHAQAFPSRPITMIFPFPAGTATDASYRAINQEASKTLGQQVVLEVRPGANARLGIMAVSKAPPDGYTLAIVNDSILVSQPIADSSFKMEMGKDYAPVGWQFEFPLALYTNPALPFSDIQGLIAYAKANPGKLNFANSPTTQFPAERFRQAAGIEVTMIPYKGSEMMLDLAAGRIDATFSGATGAPFVTAGKIKVVATTSRTRWGTFPNVPTFTESGLPVAYTVWFGLAAAPGTPADVLAKLNSAFNAAVKAPQIVKMLEGYRYVPSTSHTPKEFAALIQSEFGVWEPVIRKAGIKIN